MRVEIEICKPDTTIKFSRRTDPPTSNYNYGDINYGDMIPELRGITRNYGELRGHDTHCVI